MTTKSHQISSSCQLHLQKISHISGGKCTLIAASKRRNEAEITLAKASGVTIFGENYLQEALEKIDSYKGAELHFIGALQSKKAKDVVKHFDCIHSVDRIKLADALEKECIKQGRERLRIFLQVNIGNEDSKAGVGVSDLDSLVSHIKERCTHLYIEGLMIIPSKNGDTEAYFEQASTLNDSYGFKELSMGMSNDYELAIKKGSTFVRVGTALFGPR